MRSLTRAVLAVLLAAPALAAFAQTDLQPDLLREVLKPDRLPRGRYELILSWQAVSAPHSIGRAVADAQASGGRAWEARVGRERPSAHMLYGPYAEEPAGDYVAFFRTRLLEEAGDETVGDLDASTGNGQVGLRMQQLSGSDLALGRYVQVPLPFHHTGGKLECRLFWRGYASIRIDRIALYRLSGAPLDLRADRAEEAKPSGQPTGIVPVVERRPFPDVFPRSAPPASALVVCDVHALPPDEQMLYICLQGLVNRSQPRLYVLFNATDQQWLTWMRKRGWVKRTVTVANPRDLLARFQSAYHGAIVADPALPASKNVATMLASVRGALVASPRLARALKLPVVEDLHGRWQTSVEAYRWAFDNLWPRLNHHVIACSYPDHVGLRDYLVENRVFIFWLSGAIDGARPGANPTAEARLMEQLLARMPANIPVMSYPWAGKDVGIGEGPGVTLFAEFGKYLVGSIDTTNLSVHSGIRVARLQPPPSPPAPPLRKDRIYAAWVVSDGDNLPVLTNSNFPQLWVDRRRGTFPVGWTLSPSAAMLIPDIVDYYYSTSGPNDDWLCAVSGVGYTYPDSYGARYRAPYRAEVFDGFLDQTALYMARAGLVDAWPMGIAKPELIRRYAERIPRLQALFPDYGRRVTGYDEATYSTARGVPVFHALTEWAEGLTREQQIARVVERLKAVEPTERPAFMHLFVLNWFADLPMLQEIQRRLGPEYVFVRPNQLAELYRREMAERKVAIRMPSTISCIEGRSALFEVRVQNVGSKPTRVTLRTAGLDRAVVSPTELDLAPGQDAVVSVAGMPAASEAAVEASGEFGTRRATARMLRVPAAEVVGSLPEGGLRFALHYDAREMAHRSGREQADPLAAGKRAWEAAPGSAEPGYVIFGPYVPLEAGRYVAVFRMRRGAGGRDAGPIATIDTCVGGGQPTTSRRVVDVGDLSEDAYRSFALVLDHPGGAIETRVEWTGAAPLLVDGITLWRIVPP